ncbi:MAG: hypothetical protein HC911_15990, partial [Chloroflexaceae bacterium]|nr:hypothetical protein [Chloroflexaceae bacterium]
QHHDPDRDATANVPEQTATAGGATLTPTATSTATSTPTSTATALPTAIATQTATPAPRSTSVFLPLIVRAAPPQADLIISDLRLIPNQTSFAAGEPVLIEVTITNLGDAPTNAGFWVDVGFNPAQPPRQNLLWEDACGLVPCQGLTWGITQSLEVGASVVLRSTPDSYASDYTLWNGSLVAGTTELYVYVDVWNPATDYGAINEGPAGEQNNIRRITGLTVSGAQVSGARAAPVLPPRPQQP